MVVHYGLAHCLMLIKPCFWVYLLKETIFPNWEEIYFLALGGLNRTKSRTYISPSLHVLGDVLPMDFKPLAPLVLRLQTQNYSPSFLRPPLAHNHSMRPFSL